MREADVIVPVPLHRTRLFSRRYNQAALLARVVARLSGRPVIVDGLVRIRPTAQLARQRAWERAQTMTSAIAVRPHRLAALHDRRVVLIDDVLTTGATARVCAAALLLAGARSVDLLVAARTQAPSR